MIRRANADFWNDYHALPADIRSRADQQFALLKNNRRHRPCNSKHSASAVGKKSGPPDDFSCSPLATRH